jgi:hypothetical protein
MTTRVQPCGQADARIRLDQARLFLDVAETVHDNDLDASFNVAASLCVLAGIAASDAACCSALGERPRGQDHGGAETVVARASGVGDDMAKALRRLLGLKDDAHYGMLYISREKTAMAIRNASRLIELAERATAR